MSEFDLNNLEIRLLKLKARGLENKQIASECSLSVVSIGRAMQHICKKLGARNTTNAVVIALTRGVIEGGEDET